MTYFANKRMLTPPAVGLVLACLTLALAGCPQSPAVTPPAVPVVVPATISTAITITGANFAQGDLVRFALDTSMPITVNPSTAEAWFIAFAKNPVLAGPVLTPSTDWDSGQFIATPATLSTTQITVQTPVLLGLLNPQLVNVTVISAAGLSVAETAVADVVTFTPPPQITSVTDTETPNGATYAIVPAEFPTSVMVNGNNINTSATYQWILDGSPIAGGSGTLSDGDQAVSPKLDVMARVALQITNADNQTDTFQFALLTELASPVILKISRDAGSFLPDTPATAEVDIPSTEIPANGAATISICGQALAHDCGAVVFTDPSGSELGRVTLVPTVPDTTQIVTTAGKTTTTLTYVGTFPTGSSGVITGIENDCIPGIHTPIVSNPATTVLTVTVLFPEILGQTAVMASGTINVVQPPVLSSINSSTKVPATAIPGDDTSNLTKIALAGTIIEASQVVTGWDPAAVDDPTPSTAANPLPAISTDATVLNGVITFTRTAVPAGLALKNRGVNFMVVDPWGQKSAVMSGTTYSAPPRIMSFLISNMQGNDYNLVMAGQNWDAKPDIQFKSTNPDEPLTDISKAPANSFTLTQNALQASSTITGVTTLLQPGTQLPTVTAYVINADTQSAHLDFTPAGQLAALRDDSALGAALQAKLAAAYAFNEIPAKNGLTSDNTTPVTLTVTPNAGAALPTFGYVRLTDQSGNEIARVNFDGGPPTRINIPAVDASKVNVINVAIVDSAPPSLTVPDTLLAAGLKVVPAPVLTKNDTATVPATKITTETATVSTVPAIKVEGSNLRLGTQAMVEWAALRYGEVAPNQVGATSAQAVVSGNTLTFPRPAIGAGGGQHTTGFRLNRDAAIVAVDLFGQDSNAQGITTYVAPPEIDSFFFGLDLTKPAPADSTEQEQIRVNGANWVADPNGSTFSFLRDDNDAPITAILNKNVTIPAGLPEDNNRAVDTFQATTPVFNPLPMAVIDVDLRIVNPDGQYADISTQFTPASLRPLTVVNHATGYPAIGAVKDVSPDTNGQPKYNPHYDVNAARTVDISVALSSTPFTIAFFSNPKSASRDDILASLVGTSAEKLVTNPILNPPPVANGVISVPAPQWGDTAPTADQNVYVAIITSDGQFTPPSQFGMIVYKAPGSVDTIKTTYPLDNQKFPSNTIVTGTDDLTSMNLYFSITGSNLVPPPGATLTAPSTGSAVPGFPTVTFVVKKSSTAGDVTAPIPVAADLESQTATVVAAGQLPTNLGVTETTPGNASVSYYDVYGQKAAGDLKLTVQAGPTADAVYGKYKRPGSTTETITAGIAPGRNAADAQFMVTGTNLDQIARVRILAANGGPTLGVKITNLTFTAASNGNEASLTGSLIDAGLNQVLLPDTLKTAQLWLVAKDQQAVGVGPIILTAPPRVALVQMTSGLVSNTFIANSNVVPTFALVGDAKAPLNYASEPNFAVAATTANDFLVDATLNSGFTGGTLVNFTLKVQGTVTPAVDEILASKVGALPFTFTNGLGQLNEAPDPATYPTKPVPTAITGDDLNLVAAVGPMALNARGITAAPTAPAVAYTGDSKLLATTTGTLFPADTPAHNDAVAVWYSWMPDKEANPTDSTKNFGVDTLKVEVFKGTAGTNLSFSATAASTAQVQKSQATGSGLPAFPQLFAGGAGNADLANLTNVGSKKIVAVGKFTASGALDVAVGVETDGSTAAHTEGAVFIFQGDKTNGGLLAASATNPIKLVGITDGDLFGRCIAVGHVTDAALDDLIVGAPGVSLPDNATPHVPANAAAAAGAVYVFKGGAIVTGTAATAAKTLQLKPNDPVHPNLDLAGANYGSSVVAGTLITGTATDQVVAGASGLGKLYELSSTNAWGKTPNAANGVFGTDAIIGTFGGSANSVILPAGGALNLYDGGTAIATTVSRTVLLSGVPANGASSIAVTSDGRLIVATANGVNQYHIDLTNKPALLPNASTFEPVGTYVNPNVFGGSGYGDELGLGDLLGASAGITPGIDFLIPAPSLPFVFGVGTSDGAWTIVVPPLAE